MKQEPQVSVIVPAYNAGKYIDDCIQSVVSQTMPNWELIVVDDGSKDDTLAKTNKWSDKDKRIRVIHQENGGVSKARNAGIEAANGELLTFLDSDDLLVSVCLEVLTEGIGNADMCVFPYDTLIEGQVVKETGNRYSIEICSIPEAYKRMGNRAVIINSPFSRIFRTRKIREKGIRFKEGLQLAEDLLFNLSYLNTCDSVAFGDIVVYYYRTEFSMLSKNISLSYGSIQSECYEAHLKFTESYNIQHDFESHRRRAVKDVIVGVMASTHPIKLKFKALIDFSYSILATDYLKQNKLSSLRETMIWLFLYSLRITRKCNMVIK